MLGVGLAVGLCITVIFFWALLNINKIQVHIIDVNYQFMKCRGCLKLFTECCWSPKILAKIESCWGQFSHGLGHDLEALDSAIVLVGLEICCDRHDWRSCKSFSSCVNKKKQENSAYPLQNLRRNMKFTQLFG